MQGVTKIAIMRAVALHWESEMCNRLMWSLHLKFGLILMVGIGN